MVIKGNYSHSLIKTLVIKLSKKNTCYHLKNQHIFKIIYCPKFILDSEHA